MPKGFYKRTIWHLKRLKNRRPNYRHSEETKRKISSSSKGKKKSEEFKNKCSKRMKGIKFSKRQKELFRKALLGEKSHFWKGGVSKDRIKDGYYQRMRILRKRNCDGSHTLQEWQDLKEKYNFMCLCCKRFEPKIKLEKDHIIPLVFKGSDFISNIQPLCRSCNAVKQLKIINYTLNYV